ncbi:hypothetical protein FRAHR75_680027 [Frankia sp. Hr75.2]|nr:hypothetical protein FRAHR75_680027 [Frankia sp. Hr75.2]
MDAILYVSHNGVVWWAVPAGLPALENRPRFLRTVEEQRRHPHGPRWAARRSPPGRGP